MFQVPILVLVLVVRRVVGVQDFRRLSQAHIIFSTEEDTSSSMLFGSALAVSIRGMFFLLDQAVNPMLKGQLCTLPLVSTL